MSDTALLSTVLLLTVSLARSQQQQHDYQHMATLDARGRYVMRWSFDETSITVEVSAQTRGYVGFGFSPNGAMASSDLIFGGLADGKPYLNDYYADSKRNVHKDQVQNYKLLYARENDTHTVLAFSRKLQTCDPDDREITGSTMRVIWAFHEEDVGPSGPVYHGVNRGKKSIRLLNPVSGKSIPQDTASFDLRNVNVRVPQKDTTYWCQMYKFPDMKKKHHVIKIEPLIQKGHENLVHHILLYQCDSSLSESELEMGHECFHPNMPDSFITCQTVIFAWAIGGEGFTYPQHAGMSIGTATDPVYVLLEIHYDNPSLQRSLVDNSGLRLFYTPKLRSYDAGVIETGVWVSLYHMLPPGMQDYVTEGHCMQECLQESLESEMPSGIQVFAVLLHAHLAGRAIRTRHFRQQVELPPLSSDDQFDFNFQEFQPLNPERQLLPGDSLITECIYNTEGRKNMTWGGLSTRDEMCLSFLLYYPRINLSRCESLPEITGQLQFIGVTEIQVPITTWPFLIKSPKKYSNLSFTEAMDKFSWTDKRGKDFNEVVSKLPMNVRCSKLGYDKWNVQGTTAPPPKMKSVRPATRSECVNGSVSQSHHLLSVLFMAVLVSLIFLHDARH
ncbi:DBH-like monooxygenase protein 1 homolog isoform X1 [Tachysurus ichikawai]